ncbi:Tyrosine recombinase XerC (plasmid) [Caballeronia sp. SBC2]|nr:Tyrosine recombinase XerC [Caballeronia sp. SBC2]
METKATFDTYRKESERLLLWSITELRKPLSSLTHEDLLIYRRFLADPQPAQRWVMAGRKVARADPSWRPFAGPLSPTSERQAIVILNTLFAWLVNAGYLAGNPLSLSRQRTRKAKPRVTRFLEDDLWQAVKASIDAMPRDTAREQEYYARVRWLISLLYLMGLRISEVVSNPMGGFFRRRDRNGQDRWWLSITGKGDKERLLPATTELMAEFARYRRRYDLAALPYQRRNDAAAVADRRRPPDADPRCCASDHQAGIRQCHRALAVHGRSARTRRRTVAPGIRPLAAAHRGLTHDGRPS